MSDTITLAMTKDEAVFLNSCLIDLETIFSKGSSENEMIEKQARENGLKLKAIQAEISKQIS